MVRRRAASARWGSAFVGDAQASIAGLIALTVAPRRAFVEPSHRRSEHGNGRKKDDCVRCGEWVGGSGAIAYVADCCGFGSANQKCVVCGKWAA